MAPSSKASRGLTAAAAVLAIAVLAIAFARSRRPSAGYGARTASLVSERTRLADWCAPGYQALLGACLALDPGAGPTKALVVYLHGRYVQTAAVDEMDRQRRLGAAATARGFAVLALRGRRGECSAPELADWFCWPSNERNQDRAGPVVGAWAGALSEAERRAGTKTRFVLGFSSGGYFSGLLATRGAFDADAFVVVGAGPVEPVSTRPGARPILLLSADEDVSQDDMIKFDEELTREAWPHDAYARDGVHGLTDSDIAESLAFFTRAHDKLPLDPPLSAHRPAHHAHPAPPPEALPMPPTAEVSAEPEPPPEAPPEAPTP